jgi:hypothetical protein
MRSFVLPETTPLPNVAISDTGKLVQYILDHPEECREKIIAFFSEAISEGDKIESMASGMYLCTHGHRGLALGSSLTLKSIRHRHSLQRAPFRGVSIHAEKQNGRNLRFGLYGAAVDLPGLWHDLCSPRVHSS